jgi:serine/threonine protein kinase
MQGGYSDLSNICEVLETKTGFHIVEEYFEGGNLDRKRIENGGYFNDKICATVIEQILQVLCNLHENGIVHRNICPASIMFKSSISNEFSLKVSGYDIFSSFSNTVLQDNLCNIEY